MQYLPFGLILFFIIFALALVWSYTRRLKRDYLRRIFEKAILTQRNHLAANIPYSSEVIFQVVHWAATQRPYKVALLVDALRDGCFKKIFEFLKNTGQKDLAKKLGILLGDAKKGPLYEMPPSIHAADLMEEAQKHLAEADLLSASQKSSAAAKLFNRLSFVYEEAEAYLLLGTIYRVSAVYDVADFMLKTATKIFHYLGASIREAECDGNLGMLMAAQNRFEEAYDFFAKATKIYQKINNRFGQAEIANQTALTLLLESRREEALVAVSAALAEHKELNNLQGLAFSHEICAYLYRETQQWNKALKEAEKAAELHHICDNTASCLEMSFMIAEVSFETNHPKKAEKILREIITQNKKTPSSFQVANAYSLLGLIYLRQKDFKRAKNLFQQSLNCEIRNERSLGVLIDYANIAHTESKCGNAPQAQKYLSLAIEYAKELDEKEMLALLEKQLTQNQASSESSEKL